MPSAVKSQATSNKAGVDYRQLAANIKQWAHALGFQQLGIAECDLSQDEVWLLNWLDQGRHGDMAYMARHGRKRSRPHELLPGTLRVLSARMEYLPSVEHPPQDVLNNPELGYISRYALGRDYHKVLRQRLRALARRIEDHVGSLGSRVFVDSAPVLEKALARNAGLGWIGKHTNLIHKHSGSWFFLGELYIDLPLPADPPAQAHCGTCAACIAACPTAALVGPYELDARRCISYLTIELRGSIPPELRPLIGNRIYGCDDCQLVCPWNRYAQACDENDFAARDGLDAPRLVALFLWSEHEFYKRTEGSAIRRIGYTCWLRNIAVALGNAPTTEQVVQALASRVHDSSTLVREHVAWALAQHQTASGSLF